MRNRWHPELWKKTQDLLARGHSVESVAAIIGRPLQRLKEKIRWEAMTPAKKEKRRVRTNVVRHARRTGQELKSIRKNQVYVMESHRPDEVLLSDAQRRLLMPRTITQAILGDPPPGYSALDKRGAPL